MAKHIELYVRCECVQRKKSVTYQCAPERRIKTTAPFELISIDYVPFEKPVGNYEYILVILNYFTSFAHGYIATHQENP